MAKQGRPMIRARTKRIREEVVAFVRNNKIICSLCVCSNFIGFSFTETYLCGHTICFGAFLDVF
ncbi:unnamed protein product [Brassica oleracea]